MKEYLISKIGSVRQKIYSPSVAYRSDQFPEELRNYAAETNQGLVAIYKIPNALIPQLQSQFIITTESFVVKRSKYSDLDPIPFEKIEKINIEHRDRPDKEAEKYGTIVLTDETMVSIKFESRHREFFELLQDTILKRQAQKQTVESEESDDLEKYIEDKVQGIKEIEESRESTEENS